jgi:2-oxoglutarate dehydrogenase E2 component (dihydrolipoamide succinyltransferase)
MPIDVIMPQLGESVSEGTITKWLVHEGDVVSKDQPLLEIATDKADSELPAPTGGRVTKILAKEGDVVAVNTAVCQIEVGATASAESVGARPAAAPAPAVAPVTPVAQVASGVPANDSGGRSATGGSLASPAARKAALENDVNLADVRGSGEYGRISRDDVLRATAPAKPAASVLASVPAAAKPAAQQLSQIINQGGGFVPPIPGVGFGAFKVPQYRPVEGDRVVPFTRRRRITSDHMTYSKFASPHVVTVAEVDLHKASRLREANKERYKKEGLSLTMLAFAVVATARALREHSDLNARVLDDAYVVLKDINIGVAVDSPDGLVVPVVRRADELGLRGVVRSIDDVAKRARNGKITIDDLSGATFSITNPGLKGNLFGGAIINQPNVGILRMGEIQKRVVVVETGEGEEREDQIAIHPVMYIALSYDHRVVDGVAANGFLWRVTEIMEKGDFEV